MNRTFDPTNMGKSMSTNFRADETAAMDNQNLDTFNETIATTESSAESTTGFPRRSTRDRKSNLTYIDGHAILKTNNYVVKGGAYQFEAEGDACPRSMKREGGPLSNAPDSGADVKRIKTGTHSSRQYTPSPQELQRKAHNDRIRASKEAKNGLRQAFLSKHAETLKPFLENSVYQALNNSRNDGRTIKCTFTPRTVTQPKLVTGGTMREYQIEGLNFMYGHHERNLGIILGDEMGLGKTLQTISLLCHIKEQANATGPSLVVCPLSVLSSWSKELAFWAPSLRVLQLHGSAKSAQDKYRRILSDEGFLYDVILTTYEMVKAPALASSMARLHFNYLVLDEAHKVKCHETLIAAAVRRVHCENRLLLTGTPLQNNLVELWSLLELLYPDIFTASMPFADAFDLQENRIDSLKLVQAQKVLDLFMLRRLKSRVESLLPPKLETRVYCPLSKTQVFWYKNILMKDLASLERVERELTSGTAIDEESDDEQLVSRSARQLLTNLFMQLRKCSQHPFLFQGVEGPNPNNTTLTDLIAASGKLSVLDMLLRSLFQKSHRVVLFSQFTMVLDLLEDYCAMRGWQYARFDGGTSRAKRSFLVNQFSADDSPYFLFLMSTKAGGMGLNLQTADTCILYDSDWNPQNDLQAMARVHRIGQTKKVHVYRLISANTIEERIVERAAKKLLLDQAVNRESDSSISSTDEKGNGLGAKDLLKDIKFGCQAIFGGQTNMDLPSLEEIDEITNRQRKESDSVGKLTGGTEEDGLSFEPEKEFTATQVFGGMDYKEIRAKHEERLRQEMPKTLAGIGRLWNQIKEIQGTKRQVKKRLVMVDGHGSGYGTAYVPVLSSNNYDLESGESSVFDRELSHNKKHKFSVPRKTPRQFENSDFCQVCLDGGRLVCCPLCPVSLHVSCVGLNRENDFCRCPHHGCTECGKNGSEAGGFLYPCAVCTNCYCDECLPLKNSGFRMLGKNQRFEELGYNTTKRTAYLHCSAECEQYAIREFGWKLESRGSVCPEPLDVSFNFGSEEVDFGGLASEPSVDVGPCKPRSASIAAKQAIKKFAKAQVSKDPKRQQARGQELPGEDVIDLSESPKIVPKETKDLNNGNCALSISYVHRGIGNKNGCIREPSPTDVIMSHFN